MSTPGADAVESWGEDVDVEARLGLEPAEG